MKIIYDKEFMLGYIIGMRYGDGSIYNDNGRKFRVQVIDKEIVDYLKICFKELFDRDIKISQDYRLTKSNNMVWNFGVMNSQMYFILKHLQRQVPFQEFIYINT